MRRLIVILCAIVGAVPGRALAQLPLTQTPSTYQAEDLKRLSIEELSQLDVSTAARRIQPLDQTSAAVFVIRQEDLRRAGVATLPDALRLAAGVHAAQVFGSGWAISARGFNISTANKLLVLIDGRTVYSPVFSGVFWESQDVFLADVDRIEVIRGPGGALWGANAVNGIVNVITKTTADTQGAFVRVGVGSENRGFAGVRQGGRLGAGSYRVYGQFRAEADRPFVAGGSAKDDLQFGQSGFRIESGASGATRWLLQGDAYSARSGLADRSDTRLAGANVLSRITHTFSNDSRLQVQAYYDRTFRRVPLQYRAVRDTWDLDTQQRFAPMGRHEIIIGAGARVSRGDDLGDGPGFFFEPRLRTSTLASAFAQDEITFVRNRLFGTVGAKIERNDFSGVELQPTGRLRWAVGPKQSVWGAVSRAVRMPTRFDTDLRIRLPASDRLLITGSEDFASENVVAYEGGYRLRPVSAVSVDVAAFTNRYTDLRSQELPLTATDPVVLANTLTARTAGAEITSSIQVTSHWQMHGAYAYLRKRFGRDAESRDATNGASEANDPSHVWWLRSSLDLWRSVELDAIVRSASALPSPAVDRYTELNLRLGWRLGRNLELSVVGQNLLHRHHQEFAAGTPREYVVRGGHLRFDWAF